jgi:hypothetical protein
MFFIFLNFLRNKKKSCRGTKLLRGTKVEKPCYKRLAVKTVLRYSKISNALNRFVTGRSHGERSITDELINCNKLKDSIYI